jgi:hypothetical protein
MGKVSGLPRAVLLRPRVNIGDDSYVTAMPASGVGARSFYANLKAGKNNYGTYFLDVFKSDGITYVGTWTNVQVAAVTKLVDAGIGGLHTYKYKWRAVLNAIQLPKIRTSWGAIVNVTYIDGNSGEIATAIATITDASVNKRYNVVLPPNCTFNEKQLVFDQFIDYQIPTGSKITYSHAVGLLHDTVVWRGNNMIHGGGTIERLTYTEDGDVNYPIHLNASAIGDAILYNINLVAGGTMSKDAIGADLGGGTKLWIINCNLSASKAHGTNIHSMGGATESAQCYFINTNVTLGTSGYKGVFFGCQKTSNGKTDFLYVSGGNVGTIHVANSGAPVADGDETKVYIDPSTIWDGDASGWVDPAMNLSLTDWQNFIGSNQLSISQSSNLVSVTTSSEGSLPLDNIGNSYVALSLRRLLTSYTGNILRLRRSSDDVELDFTYNGSNLLDVSAITTWLSGATGYVTRWYMQDGSGLYVSQSDTTKQLVFVADRGDGKPSLNQNGSVRTLTGTLVSPPVKDIALIIAGALDNSSSFGTSSGWSNGINLFSYFNSNGVCINTSEGSVRFDSLVDYDASQKVFAMLYKSSIIKTYQNSVAKVNMTGSYGQLETPGGYNAINIGMSENSWSSTNSKFNEVILMESQVDETDMLTVDTHAQYWN